jgi:hypothetical protein
MASALHEYSLLAMGCLALIVHCLLWPPKALEVSCARAATINTSALIFAATPEERAARSIGPDTTRRIVDSLDVHGVAVVEDALDARLAQTLRETIVAKHEQMAKAGAMERWLDTSTIIAPDIRNHTLYDVEEVREPLMDVVGMLRQPLEAALGPDALLVELASISVGFGAEAQYWHPDSLLTANSVRLITTFVALQDIEPGMGPLEVCTGTHVCNAQGRCNAPEGGLNVTLKAGSAALMQSTLLHRGQAHIARGSPNRINFYFSFAALPRGPERFPVGPTYALKLGLWGHKKLSGLPWATDGAPGEAAQESTLMGLLYLKLQDTGPLADGVKTVLMCIAAAVAVEPIVQFVKRWI